jgi:Zn-dependent peptidase ImmA (M78 family)
MPLTHAERLLQELGITEPKEIDREAIATTPARACVSGRSTAAKRIIGNGDTAIITVNAHSHYPRKRFSIAHELGHWHHHRGKCLVCRAEEYRPRDALSPERAADGYAADLLMPHHLFRPLARQQGKLTFKTVSALAGAFTTSQTATAIRLVESDHSPALLVCHGSRGTQMVHPRPERAGKMVSAGHA